MLLSFFCFFCFFWHVTSCGCGNRYWLKIRCSSSTKTDDRGPTSSGEELTRRLESLRVQRQRGRSLKSGSSRSAGQKFRQAAKSFSNFFLGKSARSVAAGDASRAADAADDDNEVDNALYGQGTKPITVEPFIWNQFPLTVDTASLPFFRAPSGRSPIHTALGLNGGELYRSNCSTRLVPPLSSAVFCPNNGGYDIFEIFIFDSLLGESLKVSVLQKKLKQKTKKLISSECSFALKRPSFFSLPLLSASPGQQRRGRVCQVAEAA